MHPQMSLPSFEDLRKILEFWISQQDKWFYFEIGVVQSHTDSLGKQKPVHYFGTVGINGIQENVYSTHYYVQPRIIGKIYDVISYPPSLLLQETKIFTVLVNFNDAGPEFQIGTEQRKQYGLVFSQITYFEPIEDSNSFLATDKRVNIKHKVKK
jgi:hypothetical protein